MNISVANSKPLIGLSARPGPESEEGFAAVAGSLSSLRSAAIPESLNESAAVFEPDSGLTAVSVRVGGSTAVSESVGRSAKNVVTVVKVKEETIWIPLEHGSVGRTQHSPKEPCSILERRDKLASNGATNTSRPRWGKFEVVGGTRDRELWELRSGWSATPATAMLRNGGTCGSRGK